MAFELRISEEFRNHGNWILLKISEKLGTILKKSLFNSGVTRILPVVELIGTRLGNFCSVRCLFLQNYWDPLFVDRTKSFDGRTE